VYDENNLLYGWVMSKPLPTHGFTWMDEAELETWRDICCMLEVDLEYPKILHVLHNDYPLAPEHIKIGTVDKLIPNVQNMHSAVLLSCGVRLSVCLSRWRIVWKRLNLPSNIFHTSGDPVILVFPKETRL